ncbi:ABC transporter substrate-binding protein [Tenggerimyces flavus]|uniref:ABC transporter substrate-binding protein n=1 Tax=Tenggerimyces flavus TaxID=1708749 RepID=A0ABV7Y2R2_9ACTN|nr:ABC transporter substrate-binding protein [Tenggerimyces flavus]MBM7790616.1 iron complex transport system substrate-binding protein [Tenggerimyces flavus]
MSLSRRTFLGTASVLAVAAACGPDEAPSASPTTSGQATTVTNCGASLSFAQAPSRVVSTYPAMTELMIALGLTDKLAGQINTNLSPPLPEYAEEYAKVQVLAEAEPSVEVLLSARPDLILADGPYHFDGKRLPTIEDLAKRKIPVYVNQQFCEGKKLEGKVMQAYTDIENLGKIFGVADKATALADQAKGRLDAVKAKLSGVRPVRTALVTVFDKALYVDAGGLYTDVLQTAGGENLTQQSELPKGEYYGQISAEVVAKKNPDAIVFTYLDDASRRDSEAFLRAAFANTAAVKNGRMIATAEATFSGALRSFPGLEQLAKDLHPDAF